MTEVAEKIKNEVAKIIYRGLTSEDFRLWYSDEPSDDFRDDTGPGDFIKHVLGEDDCKDEDAILKDIHRLFHLDREIK